MSAADFHDFLSLEKRRREQDHETWLADVRDAERYRWLRDATLTDKITHFQASTAAEFDTAIDSILNAEMTKKAQPCADSASSPAAKDESPRALKPPGLTVRPTGSSGNWKCCNTR